MENMGQNGIEVKNNTTRKWIIIAVLAFILLALLFILRGKNETEPLNRPEEESLVDSEVQKVIPSESVYRNGIYSVVGEYISPGGRESIGVTLTLSNDVVTDSALTLNAERPISVAMQEDFNNNYKIFVIGKNIDEVELSKVSGSSLTPVGFNDAIEKIKSEARS
jgi:hypothetical protein